MAWTQVDLDAVDLAITKGVKKVTYADGRSHEFQSTREMLDLRQAMKSEIMAAASQISPRRTVVGRVTRR